VDSDEDRGSTPLASTFLITRDLLSYRFSSGNRYVCLNSPVYGELNAIGYAKFYSRSHDAVIRIYDAAGNVTETHEHKGNFKEWLKI
jgi:hypothetical protein